METDRETPPEASPQSEAGAVNTSVVELTLRRIQRTLTNSRDSAERERAIEAMLPYVWHRLPWVNYRARCILTTRIYLPYGLHPLEFASFPYQFARELRKQGFHTFPETHPERRSAIVHTLVPMLHAWHEQYKGNPTSTSPQNGPTAPRVVAPRRPPNMDVGADICEAVGRMGVYEAENELLDLLQFFFTGDNNQVRMAILLALAELPPKQLTRIWTDLKEGEYQKRRKLAAALAYMVDPDSVPFLLEVLEQQNRDMMVEIVRPLLMALGRIGDPRALPVLNRIVRDEHHPERATAQRAIRILMKQAEGMEEVTLLRGSDLSTWNQDVLLRAASESSDAPNELLRPTATEARKAEPGKPEAGGTPPDV